MRYLPLYLLLGIALNSCAIAPFSKTLIPSSEPIAISSEPEKQRLRQLSIQTQRLPENPETDDRELAFQKRSRLIREKIASQDLAERDRWWRRENIGDPHKYLLPIVLARLSLPELYNPQKSWDLLLQLDRDMPDLYHFRSLFDVRIFFLNRDSLPEAVKASYRSMLKVPRVQEWSEGGTENHAFMQRASGLALFDGSGFANDYPATAATNKAWLRAELDKFLTIGQGEFHSSTYYGYSIGGLLNLYDFAETPEYRQIAAALLDWYATNMALRLSWGTAGGAESRGFDRGTWDSGLAAVAWIWWGSGDNPNTDDAQIVDRMKQRHARLALAPALSSYRPPEHLRSLAHKQVPLPFSMRASHPVYYSYHQENHLWETFYATPDYTIGTLVEPSRSPQVKGTIRAQYATYKLVIRDPLGLNNAVVSLAGTYHSPMATGRSPADQYLQGRSAAIYQQILNVLDITAGVPPRSHLVLPQRYGEPQRHGEWYIWQIENAWLVARGWGDKIVLEVPVSDREPDYQALVAKGRKTAWIVDVARVADYPTFPNLTEALDRTQLNDRTWESEGTIEYKSLAGDRLQMTYEPYGAIGTATLNGDRRTLAESWPVLDSPYVRELLNSGILEVKDPQLGIWRLRTTPTEPKWEVKK